MSLDAIAPIYVFNVLVGIALAACVAFVALGRDRELVIWAAAFSLYPIAFTLFGLRGQIPDPVSIILGNFALALMFAFFTQGICRLYAIRLPALFIWLPPPLALAGFALLLDDLSGRVMLGASLSLYHVTLMLYIVANSVVQGDGRGKWIIFSAVMLSTLGFLLRAALIFLGIIPGTEFIAPGLTQTLFFSNAPVSLTMFAIGLLVTYMERAEKAISRIAHYDPLTQLGNRRVLQERMEAALTAKTGEARHGALIVLDLDYFKQLNDTHGHALGDQLLVEVAYRLRDSVNEDDTVVRLGGDEFVLLIENLGPSQESARLRAGKVVTRILEKLCKPYQLQCHDKDGVVTGEISYQLTVSMGVAAFSPTCKSREELFRSADAAMYRAKQSGRNCALFNGEATTLAL
jgi:diguanylate cyclase (GGDEF)-like protein